MEKFDIREKLEELEIKTIKARSAYMNSGNPEDADGLIWEGQAWDVDQEIVTAYDELEAYADKLADGLPEGMLPKDIEALRESNAAMAAEIERTRWHYPEKGELPDDGDKVLVENTNPLSDTNFSVWIYDDCDNPDFGDFHHLKRFQFKVWVKRWRYI